MCVCSYCATSLAGCTLPALLCVFCISTSFRITAVEYGSCSAIRFSCRSSCKSACSAWLSVAHVSLFLYAWLLRVCVCVFVCVCMRACMCVYMPHCLVACSLPLCQRVTTTRTSEKSYGQDFTTREVVAR